MTFILDFPIIPYTRMTRFGKFADPRARAYLANKRAIQLCLKQQMVQANWIMLPAKTSLSFALEIWRPKIHTADLENIGKALMDAANKIVYPDDRWIDAISERRYLASEHRAVFTIKVLP